MTNEVMESVVRVATLTGTRTGWNTQKMADSFKNRIWLEMSFKNCRGRFIPDTESKSLRLRRKSSAGDTYEEWLRRTTSEKSDSEVNIQFGEFTLKKHRVEVLQGSIAKMRDCVAVFGKTLAAAGIASAEVLHTSLETSVVLVCSVKAVIQKYPVCMEVPWQVQGNFKVGGWCA